MAVARWFEFDGAMDPSSRAPLNSLTRATADAEQRVAECLALLDHLYQAVEQPGHLASALGLLAGAVGATSALVQAVDGAEHRLIAVGHAAARENGSGAQRIPDAGGALAVPLAGGFELVLDRTQLPLESMAMLLRVAPHLGRVLRLGDRLSHRLERSRDLAVELDRLPVGVALLNATGRIVQINHVARAVLDEAMAIRIRDRRLVPSQTLALVQLEAQLERIALPADSERRSVGARIELEDETWGRIELLIVRISGGGLAEGIVAAALLSAPGASISPEARLRDLFQLTDLEARVAVDLLVGLTPSGPGRDGEAERALRSLYRKVGTTRQADLLHFLLRPPGVVFESSGNSFGK